MTKKLLITAILFMGSLSMGFAQASMSGSGTENDPYKIYSAYELNEVRHFTNQSGVIFKLMNDIDLADWIDDNNPGQGWEPIGVKSAPFKGVFNGNGKKLTGFSINRSSTDYVGFFGYIDGATIKDLTITGSVTGKSYVGGFVGYGTGACSLSNLTHNGNTIGTGNVGGIVGYVTGNLTGLSVVGNVESLSHYVGGIVGYVIGNLTGLSVEGDVEGSSNYIGGIVGNAINSSQSTFYITKNVRMQGNVWGSSSSNFVGGIAGCTSNSTEDAYYSGRVNGGDKVGGIVGSVLSNKSSDINVVANAHAYGTVEGTSYVGGIIGQTERNLGKTSGQSNLVKKVENCYSYCTVTGSNSYVGGVIGQGFVSVSNCASFGDITGATYVGGVIGIFGDPIVGIKLFDNNYPYSLKDSQIEEMSIVNCSAVGNVTASGNYAGGVCGIVDKCYAWSSILGSTGRDLCYIYTPTITFLNLTDCYFCGELKGKDYVGGVVGLGNHIIISRNYSNATINGAANVGGIVGSFQSNTNNLQYQKGSSVRTVSDSKIEKYSTMTSNMAVNSAVIATSDAGRIYGSKDAKATIGAVGDASVDNRALYDGRLVISGVTQAVTDNEQNGVNNGMAPFKLKATYVSHGWNFNNDWSILDTESLPYKKWQAAPPTITSNLVSGDQTISGKSLSGGKVYVKIGNNSPLAASCSGNNWTLSGIAKLKSGQEVSMYVVADGLEYSYRTKSTVGFPGSGTEADPWLVYDAYDLQGVFKPGYYKQMNDISLTSWIRANNAAKGWVPVGFSGDSPIVYDGDNHKVTGLWINTTENYNGLFSNFTKGTIRNLTVEATTKQVKGGDYTGIVIGSIGTGIIENVTAMGNVSAKGYVGGIAGYTNGTLLEKLYYSGQLTTTGNVGGITSEASATMTNCEVKDVVIKTSGSANIGGLVAIAKTSISKCQVTGSITLSGESSECYAGGLAASNTKTITECSTDVTISNTSAQGQTAGLVAYNNGTIKQCSSTGTVTSTGANAYTGGLVATNLKTIEDCYSTANVTGTKWSAGLVAYSYGKVNRCYASGNVVSIYYGAGLVGENSGVSAITTNSVALGSIIEVSDQTGWGVRVVYNFADGAAEPDKDNLYGWKEMQISVNGVPKKVDDTNLNGTAITTAQTMSRDTYESLSWDFNNVWSISANCYPKLKWQATEPDVKKGDLNGDGEIDITDIIMIIDVMSGQRTSEQEVAAADVNDDGEVDITDIIAAIDLMITQKTSNTRMTRTQARILTSDYISASMQGRDIPVNLVNQNTYCAFQMTVSVPEGMTLTDARLNGLRSDGHQIVLRQIGQNQYLIMGFSLDNDVLNGHSGCLFTLSTEGYAEGDIEFDNVQFGTPEALCYRLNSIITEAVGTETGINEVKYDSQQKDSQIYDLRGCRVVNPAKGLYIVNGKKVTIK